MQDFTFFIQSYMKLFSLVSKKLILDQIIKTHDDDDDVLKSVANIINQH